MARRTTTSPPDPLAELDKHDPLAEEADLVMTAREIFDGDIEEEEEEGPGPDLSTIPPMDPEEGTPIVKPFGLPAADDFVTITGRRGMTGGLYLPARRRIIWMRGEPVQHPDWSITTEEVEVTVGEYTGGRVAGGYARIKALISDADGRVIAEGTKTEYSERFMDYVEKAETGAIARALAVAGYGTEAALDIDEGYEDDRIADAPVAGIVAELGGRPIVIKSSEVSGLKVGGRSENITEAQMAEIARRTRETGIGLTLASVVEEVTGQVSPVDDTMTLKEAEAAIVTWVRTLSFAQGADIIATLVKMSS